jgi:ATP11 protein
MLLSQFQDPSHFLCAYLEDYKMDPQAATPLVTFSVFNDYAVEKNISLVRADVLNRGIHDQESRYVVSQLLSHYCTIEDFAAVKIFNKHPDQFDVDDFISRQNARWTSSSSFFMNTNSNCSSGGRV